MFRRRKTEGAYDWLPVVGVDIPYPDHVQAALDKVEAETRRLGRAAMQRLCIPLMINPTLLLDEAERLAPYSQGKLRDSCTMKLIDELYADIDRYRMTTKNNERKKDKRWY